MHTVDKEQPQAHKLTSLTRIVKESFLNATTDGFVKARHRLRKKIAKILRTLTENG